MYKLYTILFIALLARICSACSNLKAITARRKDCVPPIIPHLVMLVLIYFATSPPSKQNAATGSYANLGFLPGRSATAVMEALQFAFKGHDLDADDVLGSFLLRAFMYALYWA